MRMGSPTHATHPYDRDRAAAQHRQQKFYTKYQARGRTRQNTFLFVFTLFVTRMRTVGSRLSGVHRQISLSIYLPSRSRLYSSLAFEDRWSPSSSRGVLIQEECCNKVDVVPMGCYSTSTTIAGAGVKTPEQNLRCSRILHHIGN